MVVAPCFVVNPHADWPLVIEPYSFYKFIAVFIKMVSKRPENDPTSSPQENKETNTQTLAKEEGKITSSQPHLSDIPQMYVGF